jgi:hypothetical protein
MHSATSPEVTSGMPSALSAAWQDTSFEMISLLSDNADRIKECTKSGLKCLFV